jgi:phosphoribosylaminoimidazole-succinocarboxamide synthase
LPTPTRSVLLDLVIEAEDSGCLLIVEAQDGSMAFDTWHASPDEAKGAALAWFGVESDDWTAA